MKTFDVCGVECTADDFCSASTFLTELTYAYLLADGSQFLSGQEIEKLQRLSQLCMNIALGSVDL